MAARQKQDGGQDDQYFTLYEAMGIKYSSFYSLRKGANI